MPEPTTTVSAVTSRSSMGAREKTSTSIQMDRVCSRLAFIGVLRQTEMLQLNLPQVVEGLFAKSLSIKRPSRRAIDAAAVADRLVTDNALIGLGRTLKESGYRFTSITPASHARVNARRMEGPACLQEVFGWSRSFAPGEMAEDILMRLADAGELET